MSMSGLKRNLRRIGKVVAGLVLAQCWLLVGGAIVLADLGQADWNLVVVGIPLLAVLIAGSVFWVLWLRQEDDP